MRLLWVLVFVPLLGGLGLELPRLHHERHETVERATPESLHASRRETSEASPVPPSKSWPVRKSGALPGWIDAARLGPNGEMPCAARQVAQVYRQLLTRRTWQARGPPLVAVA